MAHHKIVAAGTTRVFGVGLKATYMPAPKPDALDLLAAEHRMLDKAFHMTPTGKPVAFTWGLASDEPTSYQVSIDRWLPSGLAGTSLNVLTQTVTRNAVTWIPTKVGLYEFRVRSLGQEAPDAWVSSIDGNGASRGWLLQTYLAPISGGGIK